ncbi:MAG: antitoxin [Acidimicrobiales bacterium]
MALLDTIKKALRGKGKQVEGAIDKAADLVDDKTGGKHSDKIDDVAEKAKDMVDKLDDEDGR